MVNRIKTLREQSRLTQKEVARLLDVDEATVSKLESGRRPPSPEMIERLAAIFKVGSWELFLDRRALRERPPRSGGALDATDADREEDPR